MTFSLRFFVFLSISLCALSRVQAASEWVETYSWSGSGNINTEIFITTASKWRVVYKPKGKGVFKLELCSKSDLDRVTLSSQASPNLLSGRKTIKERGHRYLAISADPSVEWKVVVEQNFTPMQEWNFLQTLKKNKMQYFRRATWTGTAGASEYEIDCEDSWLLLVDHSRNGKFEVAIVDSKTGNQLEKITHSGPAKMQTWIHSKGSFSIRVKATEQCDWRLDVCAPQ